MKLAIQKLILKLFYWKLVHFADCIVNKLLLLSDQNPSNYLNPTPLFKLYCKDLRIRMNYILHCSDNNIALWFVVIAHTFNAINLS